MMERFKRAGGIILLALGALVFIPARGAQTSSAEVRATWSKAIQDTWTYGHDKKDQALDDLRNYVNLIQQDITEMTKAVQDKTGEALEQGQAALAELETRLQIARREIEELQSADRPQWERAKTDARRAFDELKQKVERAWEKVS